MQRMVYMCVQKRLMIPCNSNCHACIVVHEAQTDNLICSCAFLMIEYSFVKSSVALYTYFSNFRVYIFETALTVAKSIYEVSFPPSKFRISRMQDSPELEGNSMLALIRYLYRSVARAHLLCQHNISML